MGIFSSHVVDSAYERIFLMRSFPNIIREKHATDDGHIAEQTVKNMCGNIEILTEQKRNKNRQKRPLWEEKKRKVEEKNAETLMESAFSLWRHKKDSNLQPFG